MIQILRFREGQLERAEGAAGIGPPPSAPGEGVWIHAEAPTPEERQALQDALALHELALEDALTEGHPPKLEDFGDHLFFIAHSPEREEAGETRKLSVFLGKNWVVSVVRAPVPCVEGAARHIEKKPKHFLTAPERVAHALLDHAVDAFQADVDRIEDDAEALEDLVLASAEREALAAILDKRREISDLLRVVRSQRDVCQSLSRTRHAVLSKKIRPYLRDVYDHCLRVHDLLEGAREAVGASRDAFFSAQSNRTNQTMRVLTVIATVMMPLGVVASIFGMNFDAIPGLHSPHGFWITTGAMVVCGALMVLWFRRRGWV